MHKAQGIASKMPRVIQGLLGKSENKTQHATQCFTQIVTLLKIRQGCLVIEFAGSPEPAQAQQFTFLQPLESNSVRCCSAGSNCLLSPRARHVSSIAIHFQQLFNDQQVLLNRLNSVQACPLVFPFQRISATLYLGSYQGLSSA